MQRLSIARSLRLALTGLTLVLALIAALGVSSLYNARQHYDDTILRTSQLASAAANLASAGVVRAEVQRDVHGARTAAARAAAAAAYRAAANRAFALAQGDPTSIQLLDAQTNRLFSPQRQLVAATAIQDWQALRQRNARAHARSQSCHALALVIVAGVLALIGALALITALVSAMRRPLDALVDATGHLAAGDLHQRVDPAGPRELRDLGAAFNAMGEGLTRATERIEQERQRLQVTVASLGDALLVTEPGSSIVATANPRAAELLPEVPVGASVEGPESPLPPLDQALEREVTIEHGEVTLAITAAVLGSQDAGVVWTVRDMSERARLERAKSEFVATASHELRSPLTSIKGFVELLGRSPQGMDARQQEFVDIILRSTDRLVELVNDLLDVARIEADIVEIRRQPIDVGEPVREVVELIGPRIAEKHQQLDTRIAPTLPLALADAGKVRQIVANLVTNAHLYTPEGGRIGVDVRADHTWVEISVTDSGIGMTPEDSERIFERFYRGAEGRTSPGTGLGLSIVKSLVDLHGGRIDVASEPGQGATFRVLLPAVISTEAPVSASSLRGRSVLIVEDEREIARLIADQLAQLDVECTIAAGGAEALELLRSRRFDAMTLDILMPGVDGFEVLRQVRADPALHAIPIVFVSVFSGRRELAGEWVVPKPIDADELRDVIAAAVSSGRSRVLVVGRPQMQAELEPALKELGIDLQWETTGPAAARVCGERRFEVALVDIGIRNPNAALQALDLRGRRVRNAVILFSDGATTPPAGLERLGMEVVPVEQAAAALLAALGRERAE